MTDIIYNMKKKYDLVVFDLDGTLLDTGPGIMSSVRYTCQTMRLSPLREDQVKRFVGPSLQKSFTEQCGLTGKALEQAVICFREHYKAGAIFSADIYSGTEETLRLLSNLGIKTAVATNKREDLAKMLMEKYGLSQYLMSICGSDFEGKLTKADVIRRAMSDCGVSDLSKVIMIGDSDNDYFGSRQVGIDFIGVTYGYGFQSEQDLQKLSATAIAGSMEEIYQLFSAR